MKLEDFPSFTPRQIEVLLLVCEGLTQEQMIERLEGIHDINSVKWHFRNIYEMVGYSSMNRLRADFCKTLEEEFQQEHMTPELLSGIIEKLHAEKEKGEDPDTKGRKVSGVVIEPETQEEEPEPERGILNWLFNIDPIWAGRTLIVFLLLIGAWITWSLFNRPTAEIEPTVEPQIAGVQPNETVQPSPTVEPTRTPQPTNTRDPTSVIVIVLTQTAAAISPTPTSTPTNTSTPTVTPTPTITLTPLPESRIVLSSNLNNRYSWREGTPNITRQYSYDGDVAFIPTGNNWFSTHLGTIGFNEDNVRFVSFKLYFIESGASLLFQTEFDDNNIWIRWGFDTRVSYQGGYTWTRMGQTTDLPVNEWIDVRLDLIEDLGARPGQNLTGLAFSSREKNVVYDYVALLNSFD